MAARTSALHLALFAGLLLGTALVGWVDAVVYPALAFTLFYLPLVASAGWWLGRTPAIVVAFFGTAVWVYAVLTYLTPAGPFTMGWNAVTRFVLLGAVGDLTAVVRKERRRLLDLARTDPLTRLPNTRGFLEVLDRETARCRRSGEPMCLAYADLDNFKRVNDLHGHTSGDRVLQRVGAVLHEALRGGDVPARIGGDEFAILFDHADPAQAEAIGRRLVERIGAIGLDYPGSRLGVSFGIVWLARPPDPEAVLSMADHAMYTAKQAGKGRVSITRIDEGGPSPTALRAAKETRLDDADPPGP